MKVVNQGPATQSLWTELSLVYEGEGRFDKASEVYLKTLNIDSSASDWGRLVYLSVLAQDKALAKEGLNAIRKKENSAQNIPFYDEMVKTLEKRPESFLIQNQKEPPSEFRSLLSPILSH